MERGGEEKTEEDGRGKIEEGTEEDETGKESRRDVDAGRKKK